MSGRLPDVLLRFVELFNREEFWECHEVLEDAWRESGSDFYHGLILYASAFVHARRGNRHGILAQLEKATAEIAPYPPAYLGLDVAKIRRHAARCRRLVEARKEPPEGKTWTDVVPFLKLELTRGRIRGDESELIPPRGSAS